MDLCLGHSQTSFASFNFFCPFCCPAQCYLLSPIPCKLAAWGKHLFSPFLSSHVPWAPCAPVHVTLCDSCSSHSSPTSQGASAAREVQPTVARAPRRRPGREHTPGSFHGQVALLVPKLHRVGREGGEQACWAGPGPTGDDSIRDMRASASREGGSVTSAS